MKAWPQDKAAGICCRIGDPYHRDIRGQQVLRCFNCDHEIYVSPTTLETLNVLPICVECFSEYRKIREPIIPPRTSAQLAEIAANTKSD